MILFLPRCLSKCTDADHESQSSLEAAINISKFQFNYQASVGPIHERYSATESIMDKASLELEISRGFFEDLLAFYFLHIGNGNREYVSSPSAVTYVVGHR